MVYRDRDIVSISFIPIRRILISSGWWDHTLYGSRNSSFANDPLNKWNASGARALCTNAKIVGSPVSKLEHLLPH